MNQTTSTPEDHLTPTWFEKFLAAVLTVFILIGFMWGYFDRLNTESRVKELSPCYERSIYDSKSNADFLDPSISASAYEKINTPSDYMSAPSFGNGESGTTKCLSASERKAITQYVIAYRVHTQAADQVSKQIPTRDEAREQYRTSLDAGKNDPTAKKLYQDEDQQLARYRFNELSAQKILKDKKQEAAPAIKHLKKVEKKRTAKHDAKTSHAKTQTFFYRLIFIALALALSFIVIQRQRNKQSRWLALSLGFVAASTILALIFAFDYLNIKDWGLLILSICGSLLTIIVFLSYQKYLRSRITHRRIKKAQCLQCGYPACDKSFCEECGSPVFENCSNCGGSRRIGAKHCHNCGN